MNRYKKKYLNTEVTKITKQSNNKISHSIYISSDIWKERRNLYFREHEQKCLRCGSLKQINLHHAVYNKDSVIGNEKDEHLFPLCSKCHRLFHKVCSGYRKMLEETIEFINGGLCTEIGAVREKSIIFRTNDKSIFKFPKVTL